MNNPQHPEIPRPRDAATVILIRETQKKPFEFFLMRRHKKQNFMGGAFVYPGGALDEGDCDAELVRHMDGISVNDAVTRLNEPETPEEKVLGLFFAAVRETFEESGVLLSDVTVNSNNPEKSRALADHLNGYRNQIHEGTLTLKDFAVRENFRYALDHLMPFARWITPEVESRRFDTRFFIARIPRHQKPEHDHIEMVESLWLTPEEAKAKNDRGEIMLMPPTLKTIEEISLFSSVDELFESVSKVKIRPILPQAFQAESGFGIKLPHDPEYAIEAYKQPFRENDPSRVVMVDGKFQIMFAHDAKAAETHGTADLKPITGGR